MRDLETDPLAAGGAATRRMLSALGHTAPRLRAAVQSGGVLRVGRLWLAHPGCDPAILTALRTGGVLGGSSALATYGIWVTCTGPVQVAMRPHAARADAGTPSVQAESRDHSAQPGGIRSATERPTLGSASEQSVEYRWCRFALDSRPWRVAVEDALVQFVARAGRDDAIASLDSALHHGLVVSSALERIFDRLPRRCSGWRRMLDPAAESGLESLLRLACVDRGWQVETQAAAPGGGRSDLLLDGWLHVEADGRRWHDDETQAWKDRRRNTAIMRSGRRWLRFGSDEIVGQRESTLDVIATVLAQGRPRRIA